MFSYHNGIKLEVNNRKMPRTSPNTSVWTLHSTLPNKPWIKEEITMEIRTYFKPDTVKTQHIKMCGM